MVVDTTYTDKENEALINDLVGKRFRLLQILRMRGIGSKRMTIDEASPNMQAYMNSVADTTYANIELRPKGVLVRINKGLKNFTWVIPYYQLQLYHTNGISIHGQGRFVHFRNNQTFRENKGFFEKLLNEKVKYDTEFHSVP
ncbi:hypothetical protein M0G43_11770 [Subsaxibacter sp. CAU 1640]|uniref:hypothetical protein n=1 Tax=Subsaxibacter sp. CAU 1640 TaxID=2933271 RepID=UPI002005541D|nr:hypothetical protein [Subsaxibacter sp. CAU 1640]MCK7591255.1 hypothetical protein [Subsaxibacter sp. CAU 1640]